MEYAAAEGTVSARRGQVWWSVGTSSGTRSHSLETPSGSATCHSRLDLYGDVVFPPVEFSLVSPDVVVSLMP